MSDDRIVQYASSAQRGPSARGPFKNLGRLLRLGFQRWQRQRAIAQLQRLSDWQLEDIGISRNDIPRVVDGLFSSKRHGWFRSFGK